MEWREIPEYPGYFVSADGQILSAKRKGVAKDRILKGGLDTAGYPIVCLSKNGRRFTLLVHKLVAEAFLGPRPQGMETRHLDGDPTNALIGNLRYGTRSENMVDRIRHGTDFNANKTHCPAGHEYTPENTYTWSGRPNTRDCRKCRTTRASAYKVRVRQLKNTTKKGTNQ